MRHVIVIFILVIVLGAVGFLYWRQQQQSLTAQQIESQPTASPSPQPKVDEKTVRNSFGSRILDKTQNPLQGKVPQANPFQNTQTNPLKNIYRNPF